MTKVILAVILILIALAIVAYFWYTNKGYIIKLIIKKKTKKFTREKLNELLKGEGHMAKNPPKGIKRVQKVAGEVIDETPYDEGGQE